MGGEQAANVLTQITKEAKLKRGQEWSPAEEEAFRQPLLQQYEREGHPLYASARLWDDGIMIDPATEMRIHLARVLNIAYASRPWPETRYGVFRM